MTSEPGMSHHWYSRLGVAECDDCGQQWPCHLSAWGNPTRVSRCNVCGGDVAWSAAFDDDGPEAA